MLNRNSKYELKFAHKSFMEYLVAKQLFEQNENPGWFSLKDVDCISNDMIPLFLFYMLSKGCPISIEFSNNKATGEPILSYDSQSLFIKDNDTTTVGLNLYAFLKTICNTKNNKWPVKIYIDCNYRYLGFITSINEIFSNHTEVAYLDKSETISIATSNKGEKYIIPNLIFKNYNFSDSEMVTFIDEIDDIIPCHLFLDEKDTPDPRIVSQLINLKRGNREEGKKGKLIIIHKKSDYKPLTGYLETLICEVLDELKLQGPPYHETVRIIDSGLLFFQDRSLSIAFDYFVDALNMTRDEFGDEHWATQKIQEIVNLMEFENGTFRSI